MTSLAAFKDIFYHDHFLFTCLVITVRVTNLVSSKNYFKSVLRVRHSLYLVTFVQMSILEAGSLTVRDFAVFPLCRPFLCVMLTYLSRLVEEYYLFIILG